MKKRLLYLFLLTTWVGFSQNYEISADGLKIQNNNEKDFLIIEIPGKDRTTLFQSSLAYLDGIQNEGKKSLNGQTENEYLSFVTKLPDFIEVNVSKKKTLMVSVKYITELLFKDGKFKYEIISLKLTTNDDEIPELLYTAETKKDFAIFNYKGELDMENLKLNLENHLNYQVEELTYFLTNNTKNDSIAGP